MKKLFVTIFSAFVLFAATSSFASTIYSIKDIGTFGGYTNYNLSNTYSGTGFVGIYGGVIQPSFAHLFGMEPNYSRTNMQVDLSSLLGQSVTSAVLNFSLLDGHYATQNAQILAFATNGVLGYNWNPTPLGVINTTVTGHAVNSIDVTSLVANALSNNENWLGLQMRGLDANEWTYTNTGFGDDRALVSLVVDTAPVPEPATCLLFAAGLGGLAIIRRREKR